MRNNATNQRQISLLLSACYADDNSVERFFARSIRGNIVVLLKATSILE